MPVGGWVIIVIIVFFGDEKEEILPTAAGKINLGESEFDISG